MNVNKRIYNLQNQNLTLSEDEIHIWNYDLGKIIPLKNQLEKILSVDELVRANKFHFEIDRERFICSRGLLRILSGVYTGISPNEINFTVNDYGKPLLSKIHNKPGFHFNLSHSKQFMAVGFVKDALIGVDVELVKPLKDHLEIAKRFFSNSEIEQLNSFPTDKILDGFYSCWTAKESVIKLSGEGLSYPLKDFDVQIKEVSIGETYKYKVNLKNQDENLFVEVFRIQKDLFGACAVDKENFKTVYCYFDDAASSINYFLENPTN
jgi:4'-phosphopantetheinyl transferase